MDGLHAVDGGVDAALAAEDIADGAPGPGAEVFDQEFVSVVEVADRLGPGRRVVGGVAHALEGVVDQGLGESVVEAAGDGDVAPGEKVLDISGGERLHRVRRAGHRRRSSTPLAAST